MSLTLALNNALSGLNVAQRSLSVLSNNVANANTPGYSRQVLELSSHHVGPYGSGVRIEQIVRKIDEYLNRSVQNQTSAVGQTQVISEYMDRIQVLMGEPGGTNSLDAYMENFFNVMQAMAETPELSSFRAQAVNSGAILAREMSALASGLEELRFQADSDIQTGIKVLNEEILRLHQTNLSIYQAHTLGQSTATLEDQRDRSLNKIAEYVDIKVNKTDTGEVYVYTTAGTPLLEYIPFQFQYNAATSLTNFTDDQPLASITVDGVKNDGTFVGRPETVVTSGVGSEITTTLTGGKIKGWLDLRDQEIPNMLAQLDQIAAQLRDSLNAIHNSGSGLPPAPQLTGERLVAADDALEWSGVVRIAALYETGGAVDSRYNNTETGYLALDLDLDALQGQYGDLLTMQNLIDEINTHFTPQNNAVVGNLQNIGLAAISDTIPDTGNTLNFDFELTNISDTSSNFWVTDLEVLDDGGVSIDLQNLQAANSVTMDAVNTFTTSVGSNVVTVAAAGHGFSDGDVVYLDNVSGPVDGIPAAEFNGQAFRISNVTANSFDIEVVTDAGGVSPTSMAGVTALEADARQDAGVKSRTGNGGYTVDLSGAPASSFYTVRATVMVEDDEGNLVATTVDYRVENNQTDTVNQRFAARAVGAGASLEVPNSHRPLLTARLVDAEGNDVGPNESGYLQITGQPVPGEPGQTYTIAIDDLNSEDLGRPNDIPPVQGTGWGFSHFFGLNNFFTSNDLTATGDTVAGSALAMAVRQEIVDNPNLVSMGTLTRSHSTPAPGEAMDYSYERTSGENSVAQLMAELGLNQVAFDAAGGLPSTYKTFNGYASEVIGYTASRAATSAAHYSDQQTLFDGYQARVDAVSGVNIDEEMANTIIFQNAYSASAQVIQTVKELFDTLIGAF